MFFGLEVKSNQNQAKPITLTNTLKLSQAVLEPGKNSKKEPVSLVAEYNKKQFILCVLDPSLAWQCPLDILFEGGSSVKFFVRGSGNVHLTGYECLDDLDEMDMDLSSDDEVGISDEEEEQAPKKITPKKAKTNGVKVPSNKKTAPTEASDDDDDDSDDDDFAITSDDEEEDDHELENSDDDIFSDEEMATDTDEEDE